MPAPVMVAPIAHRNIARSVNSGSRAALVRIVVPLAITAASRMFSVAPTDGNSSSTSAPINPRGAHPWSAPSRISNSAPRRRSPSRCMSMGRDPKSSPPGSAIRTSPTRASRAPTTRIDARILLTTSSGASAEMSSGTVTVIVVPSTVQVAPTCVRTSPISETSTMSGTFVRVWAPGASNVATRCLRTAFFAPST